LGQEQTFECTRAMSPLPPKADIDPSNLHVRFVSKAEIRGAAIAVSSYCR
jgi:hypothetical protein